MTSSKPKIGFYYSAFHDTVYLYDGNVLARLMPSHRFSDMIMGVAWAWTRSRYSLHDFMATGPELIWEMKNNKW